MPSSRIHPVQRIVKTGMTAFMLLSLAACVTAPTKVTIPLPPGQGAELTVPRNSLPPASPSNATQPSKVLPAEPAATPLPAVATEKLLADATIEPPPITTAAQPVYYQSIATYYAKRFKGRRTASGERYDPEAMTAATRDFPLQSWLKVINPANGREVIVRINDRTGKRKTPLIDLSRAAAKKLGFLEKGKIPVQVILVPPAP